MGSGSGGGGEGRPAKAASDCPTRARLLYILCPRFFGTGVSASLMSWFVLSTIIRYIIR